MVLDIADALPLIFEGAGRRTKLQKPMMLTLFLVSRGLWRRSDGDCNGTHSNRDGRNHHVGSGVDHRDGVRVIVRHVSSGPIWRDGYPNRTRSNRNGCNHGVGRGIDDRDDVGGINRHIGAGPVWRDRHIKSILICTK